MSSLHIYYYSPTSLAVKLNYGGFNYRKSIGAASSLGHG